MFIIVPKRGKQAEVGTGNTRSHPGESTEHQDDRGPVRTTIACDSCRIKKTKCNGQQPCSLCQRKRIICVFSRPTNQRELSASESRISLLQHQQRRLCTAVQQMAEVLAKYETLQVSRSSDGTFDLLELLEQYAPQHVVDENSSTPLFSDGESESRKRRREDASSTPGDPFLETSKCTADNDEARRSKPPFEVQLSEQFFARPEDTSAAYQSMIQFIQSMSSGSMDSASQLPRSAGEAISSQPTDYPYSLPTTASDAVATSHAPRDLPNLQPFDAAQQWTALVDWETSLQNLQDSHDLFFSNEDMFPTPQDNDIRDASMTETLSPHDHPI